MTRTVVTGIGIAAPNGLGAETYWAGILTAKNRIDTITRFDPSRYSVQLAGEIRDFDPAEHIPPMLVPQTDRMTQLALAATDWALADASLEPGQVPEYERSVLTSNATGGCEFLQRELAQLWSNGPAHVSTYTAFAWFHPANTGQLSIRHGLRGPTLTPVSGQAGALDAVAHARRVLAQGASLVITGGTDAPLSPLSLAAHTTSGQLSTATDPARAYLPFAAAARGWIPGEGGAILVLETETAAQARRARNVYGDIVGHAATLDPRPGSSRPPTLRRAIENALANASMTPTAIDVVFADGAGIPELDRVEAAAITAVFGEYAVPVTVPKTMTGRLHAGGSALDLATALLALRDSLIPPTIGVTEPVYPLDLVRDQPRPARLRTALVLARGIGGFNSAIIVRKP